MQDISSTVKYASLRIGLLEDAHAMKILYALAKEGATAKTILYSSISTSNRTLADRIKDLTEAELIEEIATERYPYRALQLTEKGKKVAEHVEAIERILNR